MSVSIVTFANLGRKTNLKTTEIVPIIDAFANTGELRQVICEINSGFHFKPTSPAIPTLLRYVIRAFEKASGKSLSRQTREKLFDRCAAWKLKDADVSIFHAGYMLPKTVLKARARHSITADITTYASFQTNIGLEKEELARLGYGAYEGLYADLSKNAVEKPLFDYMIATSDFSRRSFIESGFPAERTFVVYPDIDLTRFTPQLTENRQDGVFRLLYLAYTTPLKGLHYLLDAWEQANLPNAELLIVGGFTAMPDALEAWYKNRIHKNPSITSTVGTDEPEKYYAQASAFVFPSLSEGFGKVTLEAMACGIPVITTEHAAGIVKNGVSGFVLPIRDVQGLREKIEFLYHNPEKRVEMGKAARKAAENKKPSGEATVEIYKEILKRENRV